MPWTSLISLLLSLLLFLLCRRERGLSDSDRAKMQRLQRVMRRVEYAAVQCGCQPGGGPDQEGDLDSDPADPSRLPRPFTKE